MNNYFKSMQSEERILKRRSWRFWVLFWSLAGIFLMSWFIFLEYKKAGWLGLANTVAPILNIMPMEERQRDEIRGVLKIANLLKAKNDTQKFLILFQNNLELRPGGGYIGSFGILKLNKGQVIEIGIHDTNVFDSRFSTGVTPPYPMPETLNIKHWEMRDSNWYPDFPTNNKKAIEFYKIQGGNEDFDGVVAISTELLSSFLEFTGPVSLEGYPGEYNNENAVTKLEYQVQKGYKEQGIEKGERKYVIKQLANEILRKVQKLKLTEKKNLLLRIEDHLNQKDVMLEFFDPKLQTEVSSLNWGGEVKENVPQDYLMMVDANLGAYKTDYYMERSFKYQVDFRPTKPLAKLEIIYENTAKNKDWMTSDYQSYLRVYTPIESWLLNLNNHHPINFYEEFNKKAFGTLVQIPINQTKTYRFEYELPERITFDDYSLVIQKQSGISSIEGELELIDENGQSKLETLEIDRDRILK
jgi:hypothetical protein